MSTKKELKKPMANREALCAYIAGELGPEERVQLEDRLACSEELRIELASLQKTWDILGTDRIPKISADRGLADLKDRIARDSVHFRRVPRSIRPVYRAVAAVAAVILLALFLRRDRVEVPGPESIPVTQSETTISEQETRGYLARSDGSIAPGVSVAVDWTREPGFLPGDKQREPEKTIQFHDFTMSNYEYSGESPDYVAPAAILVSWDQPY